MNIKAQGLLNAAKWIEEEYGQAALRDVLRACSEPVRDRYTSAIAINWHPLAELVELVEKADALLGGGSGKIAERIGAAGARASMKGMLLRLVAYVAKPEFLMRRVSGLWSQFNDEGAMELLFVGDEGLAVEVHGVRDVEPLFCAILTGWCREVVAASGATTPIAKHVACRARSNARCIWEVRYAALTHEARPPSSRHLSTRPSLDLDPDPKSPRSSATLSIRPPITDPIPRAAPTDRPPKSKP